ncbi:lysosomal alpha-mannosidase-like [Ornithodoros turicata]|uniref:lysosomal alpha-mannosidase-like n=1 Tax=Ornithodoros turicata TaxID=34597 RepID=UPI0031392398
MRRAVLLTVSLALLTSAANLKCGYWTCPEGKAGVLNIHLVPYWRLDNEGVEAKNSFSSVLQELSPDSPRRFSFDHVSLLSRWWEDQNVSSRSRLRLLVDSGRVEPVGGGWTQTDEAAVHYTSFVDQLTLGLQWLEDHLGDCARPRVAWQLDPWGHSVEMASLFAQTGLNGIFLGRMSPPGYKFLWKADSTLGDSGEIFGVSTERGWPEGFCFDPGCTKDKLTVANGMKKAETFIRNVTSKPRKTNHILVPLGGDFQVAAYSYENIDNLIRYVNAKHRSLPKVRAFYSTPSCYLRALLETNSEWPEMDGHDLFPHSQGPAYSTGMYSSRPALKGIIRRAGAQLEVCKQLSVLGFVHSKDVTALRGTVALGQSHNIITGTGRGELLSDYEARLQAGVAQCTLVMDEALRVLLWEGNSVSQMQLNHCNGTDRGCLDVDESWLIIYNPLSFSYALYIRLPAKSGFTYLADGKPIPNVPGTNEAVARVELEALGPVAVHLSRSEASTITTVPPLPTKSHKAKSKLMVIRNKRYRVLVDTTTGLLSGVMLRGGQQVVLRQTFMAYHAYQGTSRPAADARIFSPVNEEPFHLGHNVTYRIIKGSLVQELHQEFGPWLRQVVRLYDSEDVIELEWEMGAVPVDDRKGKEIVTRFESTVRSGDRFSTDINGRRSIERRRKHQDGSPVAANFYPVTSWVFLTDDAKDLQLTVFPDRSQAASSPGPGRIELLVQRRLLGDPEEKVTGKHWIHLGSVEEGQRFLRTFGSRVAYPPVLAMVDARHTYFTNLTRTRWSGLRQPLPEHLHLLSLERISGERLLVRFEYAPPGKGQSPVHFPVSRLLKNQVLYQILETSLGSTQDKDEILHFLWRRRSPVSEAQRMRVWLKRGTRSRFEDTVSFRPGQIRTFVARADRLRSRLLPP